MEISCLDHTLLLSGPKSTPLDTIVCVPFCPPVVFMNASIPFAASFECFEIFFVWTVNLSRCLGSGLGIGRAGVLGWLILDKQCVPLSIQRGMRMRKWTFSALLHAKTSKVLRKNLHNVLGRRFGLVHARLCWH